MHKISILIKIDKFRYLRSYLKGASINVAGLQLVKSKYENAIQLLQNRLVILIIFIMLYIIHIIIVIIIVVIINHIHMTKHNNKKGGNSTK